MEEQVADNLTIPCVSDLLWPALSAVADLGGSIQRAEILEHVWVVEGLTDQQHRTRDPGPRRQVRPFHQPDDFALLDRRASRVPASKSQAVSLFLSSRFSSTISATTCFSRPFSFRDG